MGTLCTHRSVRLTALVCLLTGILMLVFARAGTVRAGGVVGNGTALSCDDAALSNRLAGGLAISFNCGTAPVTITVGSTKDIVADTTIDGGGLVTLSGGDAVRVLKVEMGATLVLNNLTVSNGLAANDYGGAIRSSGVLVANNSRVVNSQTTGGVCCSGGGGIRSDGTLTITNSVISGNASSQGGGISIGGPAAILNSQLWGNTADEFGGGVFINISGNLSVSGGSIFSNTTKSLSTGGGGGLYSLDTLSLSNVSVYGNSTPTGAISPTANGGGILIASGALALTNVILRANVADNGGGGIFMYGAATINNTTLSGNSARYGGGIFNFGTMTLNNSTLSGNSASNRGGGILSLGPVTLYTSTLSGNSASNSGGGIDNLSPFGIATLNNSTLSGNSANQQGGGMYNSSTATLTNTTLSGNSAAQQGGGIYNSMDVILFNVTSSNNTAASGGALFMDIGHTTYLTNTILAYSPAGGNCSGSITASKYSIDSDNTCGLSGPGDHYLDPLLTALGNYGGPTLVHMPKFGSPAINGIVGNDAPKTDQRGKPRPVGAYDIGSVERQSNDSDLAPRLYLPLVKR